MYAPIPPEGSDTFRLYFAHPVNVFDEPIEEEMRALIRNTFTGIEVEDPNQPHHQANYDAWSKQITKDGKYHKGMNYYYDVVLPTCHSAIGMPFLDGMFGRGVAGEMAFYVKPGVPVWWILPPSLDCIELLSENDRKAIATNDSALVLSIEETRARTWMSPKEYGKVKLSYQCAHFHGCDPKDWTIERLNYLKTCGAS
jgi:hypothetical protein